MDMIRVEEFLTLAECLSYSEAARRLYITQPVLSRHIRALEAELGGKLFWRNTCHVKLTPFGVLAVAELGAVAERYRQAVATLRMGRENENSPSQRAEE